MYVSFTFVLVCAAIYGGWHFIRFCAECHIVNKQLDAALTPEQRASIEAMLAEKAALRSREWDQVDRDRVSVKEHGMPEAEWLAFRQTPAGAVQERSDKRQGMVVLALLALLGLGIIVGVIAKHV